MLSSLICKLTSHDWTPEDFNEFIPRMDVGDEATIRCHRCNKQIVTIEKKADGGMKWTAHDPESVLYELTPKGKREMMKYGIKKNIDKFREENK